MQSHHSISAFALGLSLLCASPADARRPERKRPRAVSSALQTFERCEKERVDAASDFCVERLKTYIKRHPAEAFTAAKSVRVHAMHWEALDFFVLALGREASKKQCADADLSAAVVAGLALPSHYPAVAQAQSLLKGACNKQLESQVVAQLKQAGAAYRNNACALLSEDVRAKRCVHSDAADADVALAPPPEPTKAELVAKAPGLREAPPARRERTTRPEVQRLEDTFPSVPGQTSKTPPPAVAALRTLDWRLLDVDTESAELLRGLHGEELLLVRTKGERQPYALLKFKGVQSPWNQRVLVALERTHVAGTDYVILQDDQPSVVLTERQRQFQAFPKGTPGVLWLSPVVPSERTAQLPSRAQIASEIVAAAP